MATTAATNGVTTQATEGQIRLRPLEKVTVEVPITGLSPVIPHNWSEKAKRLMRESQSGRKARSAREPKDPEAEAEAASYRLEDGRYGIPAVAFKGAIVGAARLFEGLTLVATKQAVQVAGIGSDMLVPIEGEKELHEDTPRNASGVADLRYRYYWWPWSATLQLRFITNMIDLASLLELVNGAGEGGVGDWRPSAPKSTTGSFGRFEIDFDREVKTL